MIFKKVSIMIMGLLSIVFSLYVIDVPAASADNTIKMTVLPESVLFDVDNMKPGDWAPRTVVIKNNGMSPFNYHTVLKPDGKSLKLFNELLLEVEDAHQKLYDGRLADFKQLPARYLKAASEDELQFTIRFPEYLGNEYQGLDAKFTLVLSAEGKDTQSLSGTVSGGGSGNTIIGGSTLPHTATNIFNFILIGFILLTVGGTFFLYHKKSAKRWSE